MKYNVHVTAAFKVSHNINDVMPLLFDDQGKLRTFSEFKKAASKVFNDYNKNYLQAEWQTAFASAQAASKWTKFPEDAILQWRTQQDGRVRDGHKALHGTTYPKNHPFWETHYTPYGWRCRCFIIKVASGSPSVDPKGIPDTPAMFRQNSGITGMVFDKQSPYFQLPPEMSRAAVHVFGLEDYLPLSGKEIENYLAKYNELINNPDWDLVETNPENGTFIFKHKRADKKDLKRNIDGAKRFVKTTNEYLLINEHVLIEDFKNPEYLLRTGLSDLKTPDPEKYVSIIGGIKNAFQKASKQNIDNAIIDLIANESFIDIVKGVEEGFKHNPEINWVWLMKGLKVVKITRKDWMTKQIKFRLDGLK